MWMSLIYILGTGFMVRESKNNIHFFEVDTSKVMKTLGKERLLALQLKLRQRSGAAH